MSSRQTSLISLSFFLTERKDTLFVKISRVLSSEKYHKKQIMEMLYSGLFFDGNYLEKLIYNDLHFFRQHESWSGD